ncbi:MULTISPECIES: CHAT domain-containing protein [unclassified Saccharothrix]|uniref:CHAT domain-containing protein n=1 Tax=unclassified Saccharothrix TaxID=2593673 RepID=UPI00307E757B
MVGPGAVVAVVLAVVFGASGALPDEVRRGGTYEVVAADLVGGRECVLVLGDRPVGGCEQTRPLRATITVRADHPTGLQTLVCRGCGRPGTPVPPPAQPEVPTVAGPTSSSSSSSSKSTPPPASTTKPAIVMPSLVGDTPAVAEQRLRSLGWTGPFTAQDAWTPNSAENGLVKSHTPVAGSTLGPNAPVTVKVGKYAPGFHRRQADEVVLGTTTVVGEVSRVEAPREPPTIAAPPAPVAFRWSDLALPAGVVLALALLGTWWWLRPRRWPPGPPRWEGGPGVRPVRLALSDVDGRRHPVTRPLRPDRRYRLTLDIGALPAAGPPGDPVPLDVVVFDGPQSPVRLDLTTAAAGPVTVTVRGAGRLRCNLYCRGVLLQSFLVTSDRRGWTAKRDYVTSFGLDPAVLRHTRPHVLSVLLNHDDEDEHGVYAYFPDRAVRLTGRIPAPHVAAWNRTAAELYRHAQDVGRDRRRLPQVLGALALHGCTVESGMVPHVDRAVRRRGEDPFVLREALRGPGRVQVVWPAGDTQPLPVPLVYDYDLAEIGSWELGLCERFMDDLANRLSPVCLEGRCVTGSDRVVCPAGFWGFRFDLGSPRSLDPDRPVPDRVPLSSRPPTVVLGKATDPAFRLRDGHLEALREQVGDAVWHETDRLDELLDRLRGTQPALVYLYCHGGVYEGRGWVRVGTETLTARGLRRGLGGPWTSQPLVLLNGCRTVVLDDDTANPLAGMFEWAGAAGTVGTEVDVREPDACAFADRFVPLLLREGAEVGRALREARLELLRHGTAIGLTYTALARADVRVVPAVVEEVEA